MKIKFHKVLCESGYCPYWIDDPITKRVRYFGTLKEIKSHYGIDKLTVVGETFAINGRGKRLTFKIYEAEIPQG